MTTVSGKKVLLRGALLGVALLLGLPLLTFAAARTYASNVFPHLRPNRALNGVFSNARVAKVTFSEQHGAFLIGNTIYSAVVEGRGGPVLKLQPYVSDSSATTRYIYESWNACASLLKSPDAELRFYGNSDSKGANETYVVHRPQSGEYCLIYTQL